MKQGRCWHCEIRWTWKRDLMPDDARCPECGCLLERTTHLCEDTPKRAEVMRNISGTRILRAIPISQEATG